MKSSKKIRVGLIGCGVRLRGVVHELLKATDEVEIAAVSDPNPHSIKATQESFGPNLHVYKDYHELLRNSSIDWVMIGSWNCFHAEQVVAAFEAGKHVFCEKPLALTIDDCLAMRKSWKASGKMFAIGFTLRYSPHYRRIKEIVAAGEIGKLISFEFNETLNPDHGGFIHADWRRKTEWAGSHLLEKCCHDIDVVNWMTESLTIRAASFGGCDFFTSANASLVSRKTWDGHELFTSWNNATIMGNVINPFNDDKDIVDNQVAILQFANGVRATFHTNCSTAIPERRLYLCGTEGTLRADVLTGRIELKRLGSASIEDRSTGASGIHGGGDSFLGESLARSMLYGEEPPASLEEGLRAALTAFGIDEALRTGTVVDLTPIWERANIRPTQ
jgi:predicted dehydrogenase